MLLAALTFSAFTPPNGVKVTVIANKGDRCSICKAYAGRTVAEFIENNADNYFFFIINGITNEETKKHLNL